MLETLGIQMSKVEKWESEKPRHKEKSRYN